MPGVGIEPTSLSRHDFKSCAYTSSATRAYSIVEATARIELAHKSFADSRLTTCLRGRCFTKLVDPLSVFLAEVDGEIDSR